MDTFAEAVDVMTRTPKVLRGLFEAAPAEMLEHKPSEDGWSPRQVLAHMLHVETRVIAPRIEQMLRESEPALAPAPPASDSGTTEDLLDEWLAARSANVTMLRGLGASQLERIGHHARYGRISVREHAVEWAYHDLDHLRQLLAVYQTALYPDIGAFQQLYSAPMA